MAVAHVSGSSYTANTSATSNTLTFNWSSAFTPTAGNCLVVVISIGVDEITAVQTSGWEIVHLLDNTSGSMGAAVLIKQNCSASDTSVAVTTTFATAAGISTVREYSGGKTSGIIDANGKAEDETNVVTSAASQSTGTTGTRSQANGLGIAVVVADSGANIANDAWSSGWGSSVVYANRTTNTGHRIAEKAISSTAGDSATLTLSTSDQAYGVILILDEAGGGGATSIAFRRVFPRAILNF